MMAKAKRLGARCLGGLMLLVCMVAFTYVNLISDINRFNIPLIGVKDAFATFTAPEVSTAEYIATATVIFTAIGAIWGLRKVIKLLNRS